MSTSVLAAIPSKTVITSTGKAYALGIVDTNADAQMSILDAIKNGEVYVKLTDDAIVDLDGNPVDKSVIPEVEYTDGNVTERYAEGDGEKIIDEDNELKVESVSAINPTRIEIRFNKAIDGIKAENLYFGLTESEVIDSNIAKLNNNFENNFKLSLSKDKKVVILESQYPSAVIWKDVNTGNTAALKINKSIANNELVKNRKAYIQIRDVKVDGKLVDTMEGEFLVKDTTPADF